MTLRIAALICIACVATARADDKPDGPRPPYPPIWREAYEKGDYETAKRELLKAYTLMPNPQVLFALGQCEFNLGNYEAAIRYYEKFLESQPREREAALAQQAIGAARAKLAEPKREPEPPPPPPPPPPVVERPRRRSRRKVSVIPMPWVPDNHLLPGQHLAEIFVVTGVGILFVELLEIGGSGELHGKSSAYWSTACGLAATPNDSSATSVGICSTTGNPLSTSDAPGT